MTNRKPAKASQQFAPVASKDDKFKAIAKAEAKGKLHQRDIQAELEADKQTIDKADYWDSSLDFFSQFKAKGE